jgi:hypothetical protein
MHKLKIERLKWCTQQSGTGKKRLLNAGKGLRKWREEIFAGQKSKSGKRSVSVMKSIANINHGGAHEIFYPAHILKRWKLKAVKQFCGKKGGEI